MHLECHAILGWTIGLVGGGNTQVRRYSTVAAVISDIDAIPYVISPLLYAQLHHTYGHNVFLWVACSLFAYARFQSWRACLLIFLSFGSHLLTDAYFSGWDLYLFWPFSHAGFLFPGAVWLGHPINLYLIYAGLGLVVVLGFIYQKTPVDLVSPRLDQLLVSAFSPRRLICQKCGRKANQRCSNCTNPVCWRHAVVNRGFSVVCASCHDSKP